LEPPLVHALWLDKSNPDAPPPATLETCVMSWLRAQRDGLVRFRVWTLRQVRQLLHERYHAFVDVFELLDTEVQQCDLARLLVLHAHGGIYVDMDVVCLDAAGVAGIVDLVDAHDAAGGEHKSVALLRSPLFLEHITNCVLYGARPGERLWLAVAAHLVETVESVRDETGLSSTMRTLMRVPRLRWVVRTLMTNSITGPGCIDRTLLQHPALQRAVVELPPDRYYDGDVLCHLERGAWAGSAPDAVLRGLLPTLRAFVAGLAVMLLLCHVVG
jgi:hypothetical protein